MLCCFEEGGSGGGLGGWGRGAAGRWAATTRCLTHKSRRHPHTQIIYDPDPKQTVVEEDEALLDYWFGVDVVRGVCGWFALMLMPW